MFGKRKNTSRLAAENKSDSAPITMSLNGLKFAFDTQSNIWKVEKSELEKVAEAMNQVLDVSTCNIEYLYHTYLKQLQLGEGYSFSIITRCYAANKRFNERSN